jgi:hypothetical protein
MNRSEILQQLREKPQVSVLVVGAGINGVDVLLIDRAFAAQLTDRALDALGRVRKAATRS